MNGAFYIAATGLEAQQRALDITANNVANVNTTGFKRSGIQFSDLVMAPDSEAQTLSAQRNSRQIGVAATKVGQVWSQGSVRETGNPLNIAIDGEGLIEMMGAGGRTLLWRGGEIKVTAEGYLAAADGTLFRAMISVPQDATGIAIAQDGAVTATVSGSDGAVALGQIDLVVAKDKSSLNELGAGYYVTNEDTEMVTTRPGDEQAGRIVQGALEGANVQLSDEMVNLLMVQRAYSANAQVVQAGDQIMSIINNLRR
jgi:flagellar basal-body rod protein FlgG